MQCVWNRLRRRMLGICGPPLEIDAVARADAAGALYEKRPQHCRSSIAMAIASLSIRSPTESDWNLTFA